MKTLKLVNGMEVEGKMSVIGYWLMLFSGWIFLMIPIYLVLMCENYNRVFAGYAKFFILFLFAGIIWLLCG